MINNTTKPLINLVSKFFITNLQNDVRKGAPEYWVAVVKPGRVMFEIEGVSEEAAREAMRLASHKLPVKCKFAMKESQIAEGGEA